MCCFACRGATRTGPAHLREKIAAEITGIPRDPAVLD
jgi:hypothetical protein